MTTWLITGATGFLGRHVPGALDAELTNTGRSADRVFMLGRRCPEGLPADQFLLADLDDPDGLREAIRTIAPDQVIHTAGRTPPAADDVLYRGNFWATIRLFNALRSLNRPVRVTLAGSAAELGAVPTPELPVAETHPCNPIEAYGRSKWMATIAGLAERPPLQVNVARVFNPIGPGLPQTQAFGEFTEQLLAPAADPVPLVVGNLEIRRDFVDVRDVARALVAVALRGHSGLVYHVGTGRSRPVGQGLEQLVHLSGRSVKLCIDPNRGQRKAPLDSRADIRRIIDHTGWTPSIPFEQSIHDLWIEQMRRRDHSHSDASSIIPLTA
ncbi:MAG: NAD-dependent epimerase/dehydratase family protein [Isosphaeraceae bacterium]